MGGERRTEMRNKIKRERKGERERKWKGKEMCKFLREWKWERREGKTLKNSQTNFWILFHPSLLFDSPFSPFSLFLSPSFLLFLLFHFVSHFKQLPKLERGRKRGGEERELDSKSSTHSLILSFLSPFISSSQILRKEREREKERSIDTERKRRTFLSFLFFNFKGKKSNYFHAFPVSDNAQERTETFGKRMLEREREGWRKRERKKEWEEKEDFFSSNPFRVPEALTTIIIEGSLSSSLISFPFSLSLFLLFSSKNNVFFIPFSSLWILVTIVISWHHFFPFLLSLYLFLSSSSSFLDPWQQKCDAVQTRRKEGKRGR